MDHAETCLTPNSLLPYGRLAYETHARYHCDYKSTIPPEEPPYHPIPSRTYETAPQRKMERTPCHKENFPKVKLFHDIVPPTSPIRKKQKNDIEEIHQDAKLLAEVCHAMKENNNLKESNTQSLFQCNESASPAILNEGMTNMTPSRRIKQSCIVTPSSPQKRKLNYDNEYNSHHCTSRNYKRCNKINMSSSSDTNHTYLSTSLDDHKQILYEDSSILPKVHYEHEHDCFSRYEENDACNYCYNHDYNPPVVVSPGHHESPAFHHDYNHDFPHDYSYNDCCYCSHFPYRYYYHPPPPDPVNHDRNYNYYSPPTPIATHPICKEHKNDYITLYKKFSWKHYPKVSTIKHLQTCIILTWFSWRNF